MNILIQIAGVSAVTIHATGPKPGNGNESQSVSSAKKGVASSSENVQDDLRALQEDVVRLSQQLAKFAAAKSNEAWGLAKDNVDDVLSSAHVKGREATDAIGEVRDKVANAIEESLEKRPYTTLALAIGMG